MSEHKIILIAHCVDTEGPLFESRQATFIRLKELFGADIPPTTANFHKLLRGQLNLGGKEKEAAVVFTEHLLDYAGNWKMLDERIDAICSPDFRGRLPDSFGRGWIYNWHCVDFVGYESNPRKRSMGYHRIFDHYQQRISGNDGCRDGIHWHFHPISLFREAHKNATSYVNSPELYEILCRRVIERNWFPTVNRAGFHVERPDSHWFLEQWMPFDISNISVPENGQQSVAADYQDGRLGDWRMAPSDWSIYHPSHDNYQVPGTCRRWIARVLNVMNRFNSINQAEMDRAFARAGMGKPTLVGITGHDFRNLGAEVDHVRELLRTSARKYPDVKFRYCEAVEAFQRAIWPDGIAETPLKLAVSFHAPPEAPIPCMRVRTLKGKVFGPQPFLAIKTRSGRFIHENFDFSTTGKEWSYSFFEHTLPPEEVKNIGVAANDGYGNLWVEKFGVEQLKGLRSGS